MKSLAPALLVVVLGCGPRPGSADTSPVGLRTSADISIPTGCGDPAADGYLPCAIDHATHLLEAMDRGDGNRPLVLAMLVELTARNEESRVLASYHEMCMSMMGPPDYGMPASLHPPSVDHGQVIALANEIVETHPDSDSMDVALMYLGKSYMSEGEQVAALSALIHLVCCNHSVYAAGDGLEEWDSGALIQELMSLDLDSCSPIEPGSLHVQDAWLELGKYISGLAGTTSEDETALECLDMAVRLGPSTDTGLEARLLQGAISWRLGRAEEALRMLVDVVTACGVHESTERTESTRKKGLELIRDVLLDGDWDNDGAMDGASGPERLRDHGLFPDDPAWLPELYVLMASSYAAMQDSDECLECIHDYHGHETWKLSLETPVILFRQIGCLEAQNRIEEVPEVLEMLLGFAGDSWPELHADRPLEVLEIRYVTAKVLLDHGMAEQAEPILHGIWEEHCDDSRLSWRAWRVLLDHAELEGDEASLEELATLQSERACWYVDITDPCEQGWLRADLYESQLKMQKYAR